MEEKKRDHSPRESRHPSTKEVTLEDWLTTQIVTGSSHLKRLCTDNSQIYIRNSILYNLYHLFIYYIYFFEK